MSDANFYQVLGVERSASADKIKSAYRELVRRYHPDLFAAAGEKAKATEKMRQLNEAYAVLGNAERRQRYDQEFIQQPKTAPRAPVAAQRRRTARPGRSVTQRTKTANILKGCLHFSKKRAGYALAAATVVMILIYAGRSVPRLVTSWILVEKLEFSPAKSSSPPGGAGQGWVRLGEYASVSECAGIVNEKVRKDKQEGSQAVFVDRNGTMAITVHVKKETAQVRDGFDSNVKPERSAADEDASKDEGRRLRQQATEQATESFPRNGMTKRVRSLECRETQRLETEPWIRRALRRVGTLL
jgi:curved DNA-binding protein CbpA